MATVISIIALLVSLAGYIHTHNIHSRQTRLESAQKIQELRIDVHHIAVSLLELLRELVLDSENENQEIANYINDSLEGLISVKKSLQDIGDKAPELSWIPGYGKIETGYERMKGDIDELTAVVHSAWDAFNDRDYSQLLTISKGIDERVYGKEKT